MRAVAALLALFLLAGRLHAAAANEHYRRAQSLIDRKDCASAVGELLAATRLNPRFGLAYYWLGVCELQQGRAQDALRDLRVAKANTTDTRALAMIARPLGFLEANQVAKDRAAEARVAERKVKLAVGILIAFGALVLIWLAALVFRSRSRAAAAVDGSPSSAPATPDELRRLTAGWAVEPELMMTPAPREVRFVGYKPFVILGVVMAVGIGLGVGPSAYFAYQRRAVLQGGVASTGNFERSYESLVHGRHGTYKRQHVVFTYAPGDGRTWRADRLVGRPAGFTPGQPLSIHFLRDQPGRSVLDDDLGYAQRQQQSLWISAAVVGAVFAIAMLAGVPELRRQRDLVVRGQPAAAWVESVKTPSKAPGIARLRFEAGGMVQSVECRFNAQNGTVAAGEVLTVLFDPEKPEAAAIYRLAPYRAGAS